VHPGDIIVGDLNGVVVVPQEMAVDLLERLRLRRTLEAEYKENVRRGEFSNAWVDRLFAEAGVHTDGPGPVANGGGAP
jgi:regulator of RNase E activity RraA